VSKTASHTRENAGAWGIDRLVWQNYVIWFSYFTDFAHAPCRGIFAGFLKQNCSSLTWHFKDIYHPVFQPLNSWFGGVIMLKEPSWFYCNLYHPSSPLRWQEHQTQPIWNPPTTGYEPMVLYIWFSSELQLLILAKMLIWLQQLLQHCQVQLITGISNFR